MKKSHRILALAGIVLLLAMYASTLLFALMDSPSAKGLFMASLFCTFAVPILLFAMIQTARLLRGRGAKDAPLPGEQAEKGGDTDLTPVSAPAEAPENNENESSETQV